MRTWENSNYPSQESEILVKSFSQTMHDFIINLHHKRRKKKYRVSLWPSDHLWCGQSGIHEEYKKDKQIRYKVIGNLFIAASFTAIQMINISCHILGTATGTWQSGQWMIVCLINTSKYCNIAKFLFLFSFSFFDFSEILRLIDNLAIWDFEVE